MSHSNDLLSFSLWFVYSFQDRQTIIEILSGAYSLQQDKWKKDGKRMEKGCKKDNAF